MPAPAIRIAPDLNLPLDAVTQVVALLAKRGAGKTHTAAVFVEELVDAGAQVVVLDPLGAWWGLKSVANGRAAGLPFVVLGGDHGDLPLESTAGALIADTIVEDNVLVVVDLSGFDTRAEQCRFVTDFCDRLYRRNRDPLHVVLEEADEFAPQQPLPGEQKMLSNVQRLVRRGRQRGIGVTLISQRSAALSKGVLTQADLLLALRTTAPQDIKAIKDWITTKGVDEHAEVLASLSSLPTGTAWVWAPEWDILARAKVRKRRTFDSSATPKLGDKRRVPTSFASVDLEGLRVRMAETIERVERDDPAKLQRRITELERALRKKPTAEPVVHTVEIPVVPEGVAKLVDQVAAVADQLQKYHDSIGAALAELAATSRALADAAAATPERDTAPPVASRRRQPAHTGRPTPTRHNQPPPVAAAAPAETDLHLKAGARKILHVIARHYPVRLTRAQIGTLTGFKVTGGTFQTYYSTLRRAGYLDEGADKLVTVTEQGLEAAGIDEPQPMTPEEILEMWRTRLKRGARDMLDVLVDAYPETVTRAELADHLGMAETGGTFQTYLSTLRRNQLADVAGPTVRAAAAVVDP